MYFGFCIVFTVAPLETRSHLIEACLCIDATLTFNSVFKHAMAAHYALVLPPHSDFVGTISLTTAVTTHNKSSLVC